MELEKINSEKFKELSIEKNQMNRIKGGLMDYGTRTPGGNITAPHNGSWANFDYGYDSGRSQGVITYHNRSNITYI